MVVIDDIRGTVFQGGTLTALARITDWDGDTLTQADTTSIAYTIFNQDGTTVSGQSAVSVTPSTVIYDTPVVDGLWDLDSIGYSFKHTIDVTTHAAFTTVGNTYLVVYTITPTSGQNIIVRYRIRVI